MKPLLTLIVLVFISAFAQAEETIYKKMEKVFQSASEPKLESLSGGWFTGRCYTRSAPDVEKSGVLVLIPTEEGGFKQIIPASSIHTEADYFDEITDEEYEIYREELYAGNNSPAILQDGSLMSELHYSILIGKLYTRQVGSELIVTMTNYSETPADKNAFFYCRISKKVHELN